MPELPDITVYLEALAKRVLGQRLERVRNVSPFLLRTARPGVEMAFGRKVKELRRMGKRICMGLEGEIWLVLHLMIAGRLHWLEAASKKSKSVSRNGNFLAFDFSNGSLMCSEAGSQKRASLHVMSGEDGLRQLDPGGLEVLECDAGAFQKMLLSENHTLKRALTDPTLFSGIGNAYSDEILWEARLSPAALTQKLAPAEIGRLYEAIRKSLTEWVERLRRDSGDKFPEGVTAFRPEMAVHGKYRQPCPRCGTAVQRIKYAANETNYCPTCQTNGRLLADRAFSRLLREDWPKTLEELETKMGKKKDLPKGPAEGNPSSASDR